MKYPAAVSLITFASIAHAGPQFVQDARTVSGVLGEQHELTWASDKSFFSNVVLSTTLGDAPSFNSGGVLQISQSSQLGDDGISFGGAATSHQTYSDDGTASGVWGTGQSSARVMFEITQPTTYTLAASLLPQAGDLHASNRDAFLEVGLFDTTGRLLAGLPAPRNGNFESRTWTGTLAPGAYVFDSSLHASEGNDSDGPQIAAVYSTQLNMVQTVPIPLGIWMGGAMLSGVIAYQRRRRTR